MRPAIVLSLCLAWLHGLAQQPNGDLAPPKKKRKIELRNAEVLEYDETLGSKARRLLGNVVFEHEGSVMHCDSAYLYENNSLDAFSNVRVNRGDTIQLFCQKLNYDGNSEFAKARVAVRLIDRGMTVTSEALDYDMATDRAWYLHFGKVENADNTLTSRIGYYFSKTEETFFKDRVKLVNKDYTLWGDTLRYNSRTETAFFLGPTRIVSKENTVLCTHGWYDTERDISQFDRRATILSKGQSIIGDSIYYHKRHGYGLAIGNVVVNDSAQSVQLTGGRARYLERGSLVLMTDSAMMMQDMKGDTLHLHADTLLSLLDTVIDRRLMFAYHRVKFFKEDMQGKCDSLVYSYVDSTIRMFQLPVLWSDENQLTADTIRIEMRNGEVDRLHMRHAALIISEQDSVSFNQIKGRNMVGTFRERKLYRVDVTGDGESIYFGSEAGEEAENVNRCAASNLVIFVEDSKVKQITFLSAPDATLYPIKDVDPAQMRLSGFLWRSAERPLAIGDIFRWEDPPRPAKEQKGKGKGSAMRSASGGQPGSGPPKPEGEGLGGKRGMGQ